MGKLLILEQRFFGQNISLADTPPPASGPVWIQVAAEGEFKGYPDGPLNLDETWFNAAIKNFHEHPSFRAGTDGVGIDPVIPFDYEHASEMGPQLVPSIAKEGVPAIAWALDLQTRKGDDGEVQLWAFVELGDKLRQQIKKKEYRWTSIAAARNAKDKMTGEKIGPVITSIAVTNRPFIQGMEPMAASVSVYGKAENPEQVVVGLQEILGLENSPAPELAAELNNLLVAYQEKRPYPACPGPDGVSHLLDAVRRLVGVKVLASAEEIVAAAGQALSAQSTSNPTQPARAAQPPAGTTMSEKLREKLVVLFDVRDSDESILAAAAKAQGSLAVVSELMKTYGATTPQELATKASEARDAAAKAAEVGTKMAELLATLDGNAEEEQKKETEQVAASLGFGTDARGVSGRSVIMAAGLAARRAALGIIVGPAAADGKPTLTLGAKDASKFAEYRTHYPLPNEEQQKNALLTTPITAGLGGRQLGGSHTALPAGGAPPRQPEQPTLPKHIEEIQSYPGANNVQRAIAMLNEKQAGFSKLDWGRQNYLAGQYLLTGKAA